MKNASSYRNDLDEIKKFHETDIAASKDRKFDILRSLISDDAIILPHGGDVIQGALQIDDWFLKMNESMRNLEVLEYSMDFKDIQIVGDYAFEWGYLQGAMRNTQNGQIQKSTYKIFRILKKENDQWKVYRSMWSQ